MTVLTLLTLLGIPAGTSAVEYILSTLVEFTLFCVLIVLTIITLNRYLKRRIPIRLVVSLIFLTYSVVLGGMGLSKFLFWLDIVGPETVIGLGDRVAEIGMLFNCMALWVFLGEIFMSDQKKKRIFLILINSFILMVIILRLASVATYESVSGLILLMGLSIYIWMARSSLIMSKKASEVSDKARLVTMARAGIIMLISYCASVFTGVGTNLAWFNTYHPIRIISALFGLFAMLMIYWAFFPPSWMLLQFIKTVSLPEIDNAIYPIRFEDDGPQLSDAQAKGTEHCVEWWYYDWEDFSTKAKIVCIFKRCDTTTYPGFGGVHLEITTPDGKEYKLYKKTAFSQFKTESTADSMRIEVYPNNYFVLNKASSGAMSGTIGRIQLHAEIGDAIIDLNAEAKAPGVKIGPEGFYYISKINSQSKMGAALAAPYFTGNSTVVYKGAKFDMKCTGYHDHTYGTADLLDTNKQWYWMRGYFKTPNGGTLYMMYGDVEPQSMFYGRMKYLIIMPEEGEKALTDINFKITATDFKKHTKLKFPRKLTVDIAGLKSSLQMEFIENHFDQMVYNRSLFKAILKTPLYPVPLESKVLVEYYDMPSWLTLIIRPAVKKQYNAWMVDK